MEGAGTYELPVAGMFAIAGLPLVIVNPKNIREFALSLFRYRIGQKAEVELLRGAQRIQASVPVIERADDPPGRWHQRRHLHRA